MFLERFISIFPFFSAELNDVEQLCECSLLERKMLYVANYIPFDILFWWEIILCKSYFRNWSGFIFRLRDYMGRC